MSSKNETVTISSNGCYAARKSADTGIVLVSYVVIMEDAPVHTAANGYSCNDLTCPCQTNLDEYAEFLKEYPLTSYLDDATMPDDIRKYYQPIEDSSYDHPGVPAPCWENVDQEEYPLARRTFEYDVPEAQNGRTYRTTSSRVDWE